MPTPRAELADITARTLAAATAGSATDEESEPDWGVPLLVRLSGADHAAAVVIAWVTRYRTGLPHPGLVGRGMAGTALGLAEATRTEPRLGALAATARDALVGWAERSAHRRDGVGYADYDLILGASGATLALAALPGTNESHMRALAAYLTELSDDPSLARLRMGDDGGRARTRWNLGRINNGLGHGVPGVLAALIAAWPLLPGMDRDRSGIAIRHISDYLVRAHRRDARGALTWDYASEEARPIPASRRQAWCYGTPGVSWQLFEAGRVLGDEPLSDFAVAAMDSFCQAWDDDYYLDDGTAGDRLAFCHGAAGNLAVADAFAVHAGLASAGHLADHLNRLLRSDLDSVAVLAESDATMLTGASGILAVLLSRGAENRGWLRAVGLR